MRMNEIKIHTTRKTSPNSVHGCVKTYHIEFATEVGFTSKTMVKKNDKNKECQAILTCSNFDFWWPIGGKQRNPIFGYKEMCYLDYWMHYTLSQHSSKSQFQKVFHRHFYALDLENAVSLITLSCAQCATLTKLPKRLLNFQPQISHPYQVSHLHVMWCVVQNRKYL